MAVYQLTGRLQSLGNTANNCFASSTSIVARCFHAFSCASEDMFIFTILKMTFFYYIFQEN